MCSHADPPHHPTKLLNHWSSGMEMRGLTDGLDPQIVRIAMIKLLSQPPLFDNKSPAIDRQIHGC